VNPERELIIALCVRSADAWARGELFQAESWFEGAIQVVEGGAFVDDGADR
jgi:hypothetical protein